MPPLQTAPRGLQMFYDAPPVHTHQKCSNCFVMQRGHGGKLLVCQGCLFNTYCSKQCQVAHRPTHKAECKLHMLERSSLAGRSGVPSALADVYAWMAYYDAPMKNAAVAGMGLQFVTHKERTHVLNVQIRHKGDCTLPVIDRFIVESIGLEPASAFEAFPRLHAPPGTYAQSCEKGRLEMGDDFYGVVRIAFTAFFGPEDAPTAATMRWKAFAIDKTTAHANVIRADWWILFREYVAAGAKMKFCCGKVASEDVCCCGGWVHDAAQRETFSNIGR